MAVTSKPIEPARRADRKPGAIVSSAQLERTRGAFERLTGLAVLVLSLLGTIVAFHGGWEPVLSGQWRMSAVGWGLAAQAFLTALQWWYGRLSRTHPIYLVSLGIDTGLTTIGYGPLIVPMLAPIIAERGIAEPVLAAWLALAGAAFVVAWYPESRLVD